MHKRCCAVSVRLSVRLSVSRSCMFQIFAPSGSHAILVCPYQASWRYSDRDPDMVGMGKWWPPRSDWILMLIRVRVWIYGHFSTSLNITQIGDNTIYYHSTEGASALLLRCSCTLPDNAAALAEFELSEHILYIMSIRNWSG